MTRLRGHGLLHEGRPVLARFCCGLADGSNHGDRNRYDRQGHGACSCGSMSGHEESSAARQRWHREHKGQMSRHDS